MNNFDKNLQLKKKCNRYFTTIGEFKLNYDMTLNTFSLALLTF